MPQCVCGNDLPPVVHGSGRHRRYCSEWCRRHDGRAHAVARRTFEQLRPGRTERQQTIVPAPGVWMFDLALPEQTRLLFDVRARTVALFSTQHETSHAVLLPAFRLTPTETQVLLVLCQAYPHHASHHALCAALSPYTSSPHTHEWGLQRSLRRALGTLAPLLHQLGLQIVTLRTTGYQLVLLPSCLSDP